VISSQELEPRSLEELPSRNPPLRLMMAYDGEHHKLTPSRVIQGGLSRLYVCPALPHWRQVTDVVVVKRPREWFEGADQVTIFGKPIYGNPFRTMHI
jgi:hypothetical protein